MNASEVQNLRREIARMNDDTAFRSRTDDAERNSTEEMESEHPMRIPTMRRLPPYRN
jgi:hypothetical protein